MGYNSKKTFRKPGEKFAGSKSDGHLCKKYQTVVKPNCSKPYPVLNKKCNTCEKKHFAKKCKTKTQPQTYLTFTTISARKRVSCLIKPHPKWRWDCRENIQLGKTIQGKTCLTCQQHGSTLQLKTIKQKMQVNIFAVSTVLSSFIWIEFRKTQLKTENQTSLGLLW